MVKVNTAEIPAGISELARLASLQASGVARVCTRLEDLGLLEAVGRGSRNRQYRAARRSPLVTALSSLFREERARAERILQELRNAASSSSLIRAAWLEGPVAEGRDAPGDNLVVGVLADSAGVGAAGVDIWPRLMAVQRDFDVSVELRITTPADLKTASERRLADLEHVLLLKGAPPLDVLRSGASRKPVRRGSRIKSHEDLDARAMALARAVADRIGKDPSIVENAGRFLQRRLAGASPGERLELEEWIDLLTTMSPSRLRRFLVQDNARAARLRQSLPFLGVLSPGERQSIIRPGT